MEMAGQEIVIDDYQWCVIGNTEHEAAVLKTMIREREKISV